MKKDIYNAVEVNLRIWTNGFHVTYFQVLKRRTPAMPKAKKILLIKMIVTQPKPYIQ